MSQIVKKFLDDENWLYIERTTYSQWSYTWRYGHEGPHRFQGDQCPCGVMDLGVIK